MAGIEVGRRVVGAVATLVSIVVLAGCSGSPATGDKGYVDGSGIITRLAPEDRERPGEVRGETLEGKQLPLADYRGRVVVLNVWGSWCPPCEAEAPDLNAVMTEFAAAKKPVVFMGINERDNPDSGRAAEKSFPVEFPSLDNSGGLLLLQLQGKASTIPGTLVLDAKGRIAARIGGGTTQSTLTGLVDDVLAESA